MTSLTTSSDIPKRGEIWLIDFDPTVGAEIKKVAIVSVTEFEV